MWIFLILLLATPALAADLVWDTPASRRCFQHLDLDGTRWTSIRDTSDCPADNPADECEALAAWSNQSPSNDGSCPLWLMSTRNLRERDLGKLWNYDIGGGYGNPLTVHLRYTSTSCNATEMGFEWAEVDKSFKDLTGTLGPDLENLSTLTITANGHMNYIPGNCVEPPEIRLTASVIYPNLHQDQVSIILTHGLDAASTVIETNYNATDQTCGGGADTRCHTVLQGTNLYRTSNTQGLSKIPFTPWRNLHSSHLSLDLIPLFKDRLYVPPPPLGYTLADAKIHRVRLFSRIFGGTMSLKLRNLTATGS